MWYMKYNHKRVLTKQTGVLYKWKEYFNGLFKMKNFLRGNRWSWDTSDMVE